MGRPSNLTLGCHAVCPWPLLLLTVEETGFSKRYSEESANGNAHDSKTNVLRMTGVFPGGEHEVAIIELAQRRLAG